ncbi:tetratricopeptide repeat protein [Aureimonas endophytica]|nr:tetratricopeptide repeat protein [Aureimonas endophytica]
MLAIAAFGLCDREVRAQTSGVLQPAAEAGSATDAQSRYDRALAGVQGDMGNPAMSFELAEAATQSGNVRAAIAALESVLLIDPTLSNIKLELGVLYLRAGSPAIAKRFIDEALSDPAAPADVRARAKEYADLASVQSRPWSVTGDVYAGLRYETNANGATKNSSIGFIGSNNTPLIGTIDPSSKGQEDISAVFNARSRIAYDLGLQSGSSIVANLGYSTSKYFKRTDLNLDILNVDLGPSLVFGGEGEANWIARPYVSGALVYRDQNFYQSDTGLGLSVSGPIGGGFGFTGDVSARYLDYQETSLYPVNDRKDGWSYDAAPGLSYAVSPSLLLQANLLVGRVDARAESESYWQKGIRASVVQGFANPFGFDTPAWTGTLSGGYRNLDYDAPDRVFSLREAQNDDRYDIGLSLQMPFRTNLALVGDVRYTRSISNYDLYDYDNFATSLGLAVKF